MIAKMIILSLAVCIVIPAVLSEFNNPTEIASGVGNKHQIPLQYVNNIEDMKMIIDAYRNMNRRLSTNFESPNDQDSKYQVWKRNADIINTLLGIPRRMLEIGR